MATTYRADSNLNDVYIGRQTKQPIARMYVRHDGTKELRTLQGMPRGETLAQIIRDCPEFCEKNGITLSTITKVFGATKHKRR